jgi:tape measure domain-containing protein
MSTVIDEKIVSMQFDNKNFEKNTAVTMDSLRRLESTACQSGFHIQDVWHKMSNVFEYQIARSIINSAKNITAALTIEPVSTGLKEYETQLNAVQTILANTESKGTTLDDVNAALDTLNTYADKTIYNFTEMTRNIGTFTAAGVDLDTSVSAIQGIANLAAVSGSSSQQASTAMYQLSQALSTGTVRLMDWNSVVNAGMGGEVFQNALKETAKAHGVAIDEIIESRGSFRESLQDEWLTSEILTETLEKFTYSAKEGTEEWNNLVESLQAKGYTKAQAEEIIKMGNTATDAATTNPVYSGKVIITALEANAPNGDNATFTASFEGVGALTKKAVA